MAKPGRRVNTPSDEIARFTDREDQQSVFQRHLNAAEESPVLVFYGVGGAGKSWLLKKLRLQTPAEIPRAALDLDVAAGGRRYALDPTTAMQSIQTQLNVATPQFELALAMLRHKQGHTAEPSMWLDVAAELVGGLAPGGGTALKWLSKPVLARLKGSGLEKFLASLAGTNLALELRAKTEQEIENELLYYLAADLRKSLPVHLQKAVRCVIFLDTFEAVSAGLQNEEHRQLQEKWIRDLTAEFDFALTVIAGQNRISWDEVDPEWASHLDQHLVGGLSASDTRRFLNGCGIEAKDLQDAILATSKESSEGYHCFSLGLCADIVFNERRAGREPKASTLQFHPQDWERIARRFLKSLTSSAERRWIERLALTPRFDEAAARQAFSSERGAAQDAAWEALPDYSFVELLPDGVWRAIRAEMRSALRHQPSAQERVEQDHQWWREYWQSRSQSDGDEMAGLAWYHLYFLDTEGALFRWEQLTEEARTASPPRMRDHISLLRWMDSLEIFDRHPHTREEADVLFSLATELLRSSFNRNSNPQKAIAYFDAALQFVNEQEYPVQWASIQLNLGVAWDDLATGDQAANLRHAIACYEASLRIFTKEEFPAQWAMAQNNLGTASMYFPTGSRSENLKRAIGHLEACLEVRTEEVSGEAWALTQNNLGVAWSLLMTGDRKRNQERAIAYLEDSLRVYTEEEFPVEWARTQQNLGTTWHELLGDNKEENLTKAIACSEAALRVYTEQNFPQERAQLLTNMANVWLIMTGDDAARIKKAIAYYEEALKVYTEQDFPIGWGLIQNNLGRAWFQLESGDKQENLDKAIHCYNSALRVRTEEAFPDDWAETMINIGQAWYQRSPDPEGKTLANARSYAEASLRVFTEQEYPSHWAIAKSDLGSIYDRLEAGNRAENLRRAISMFEESLRIYSAQDYPKEHQEVVQRLDQARAKLAEIEDQSGSHGPDGIRVN